MTLKERQRVLEVCRRHWKGVLVNGISSNNVADTLQLLRHTQQHAHESDQVSSSDPGKTSASGTEGLQAWLEASGGARCAASQWLRRDVHVLCCCCVVLVPDAQVPSTNGGRCSVCEPHLLPVHRP